MYRIPIALALIAAATPPTERVIDGDAMLDVTIDGLPTRLRVDPAAPGMPLIDLALAERAGLKLTGKWGIGIGYAVGNTSVMTRTQVVRLDLGRGPDKTRVGWARHPFTSAAPASVGPGGLPEPIVRFQLRTASPGETTVTLRAVSGSALFGLFGNFGATFAEIEVGGEPMRVRLDPHHPRTLATAGAAVRLAQLHDGVVSGEPVSTEIFFGVERPVRTLTLRKPLAIGVLAIPVLGVRTGDYGNAASIVDADAPVNVPDPDEVVVTAKGKKRDPRRDTISLGADYLARCSSIVFDKPAKQIRLTCS